MRRVNKEHIRSADYTVFDAVPAPATGDGLIYSYVMEHGGQFARLDIRSDSSGQFEVMGSLVPDQSVEIGVVTWIPIVAARRRSNAFEEFCAQGPERVLSTEPKTLLWFFLKDRSNADQYAIIDLYRDTSGLIEHNNGEVAASLKEVAPTLVVGAWKAVVTNALVYNVTAQI